MNQGDGTFKMLDEAAIKEIMGKPNLANDIFREGETVQIRNSKFRITAIRPNGNMRLKLLPNK